MKGRRNRLEIIGEILELAGLGGMTKTGIAYKTNLGFGLAQKYIDELMGRGLLEMKFNGGESSRRVYCITEEGRRVLRKLRELRRMFC